MEKRLTSLVMALQSLAETPALYQEVKDMLWLMQEIQIIWPSRSPLASPILLVKKKDGTLLFYMDHWHLNALTT